MADTINPRAGVGARNAHLPRGPTASIDRTDHTEERPPRQRAAFPPSLVCSFDASVHYGSDHATPVSGAVGFVVEEGTETRIERSLRVRNLVSSTALEYRALLEAALAVDETFDEVASLHVRGDADVVLDAVDRRIDAMPSGRVERRRVRRIRRLFDAIPTVTYRVVPRGLNEQAHRLARAGHHDDHADVYRTNLGRTHSGRGDD